MGRMVRQLVFVSDAPHFGGAERYVIAMALAARRRGIGASIFWLPQLGCDTDVFESVCCNGIRLETVPPVRTASLRGLTREFLAMLRRERPDGLVINACGRPRFWSLPWLAWQAGVPAVWVHQMVDAGDHRRLPPRLLGGRMEGPQCWRLPQALRHRVAGAGATAVITLNGADRDRIVRWQGIRRDKVMAIPHGVDCERFRFDAEGRRRWRRQWNVEASAPRPLVVGTAGRLSREKGVDLLIESTAIARREGLPLLTVIAGQGSQRDALETLAADSGVSDAVRFVSFVDDMAAFYSALDIFVLCSRTESFGLALAEAMACQRSVVATPTSGSSRQIRHGENGWLLSGFEAAEMAGCLVRLAADPQARERMAQAGRETVIRNFSIDLTLERTLRALRGIARERSSLCWPGMSEPPFVNMTAEDCA